MMFRMTKVTEYITEIVWYDHLELVPLLQVYHILRESLLPSADREVYPRLGARDRALWSAKVLLHLYN